MGRERKTNVTFGQAQEIVDDIHKKNLQEYQSRDRDLLEDLKEIVRTPTLVPNSLQIGYDSLNQVTSYTYRTTSPPAPPPPSP